MQIQVQDVMDKRPVCLPRDATLTEAIQTLLDHDVSQMYVVDDQHCLLGVLTDFELLKAQLMTLPGDQSVTAHMNAQITAISPSLPVSRLAPSFRDSSCSLAAVVDQGQLVGHIDRRTIIQLISLLDSCDSESCGTPHRQPVQHDVASESISAPRFLKQTARVHS